MIPAKEIPDPFAIVASALGCQREALSIESAMYRDHGWDSFGHLSVILTLEQTYGIHIDDKTIEKYVTMRAIQQLYEEILRGGEGSGG